MRVLVFSAHSEAELVEQMLAAGADGYYVKGDRGGPENIATAVQSVARGERWLSPLLVGRFAPPDEMLTARQMEILRLAAQGQTNRQIALSMDLSRRTVESHMERIIKRLGVQSRTEACMLARKKGWIPY